MLRATLSPPGRFERGIQVCLLLALFTVPFATALTNLFAALALLGGLAGLALSRPARITLRQGPSWLALALLAALLIGAAWTIAPQPDLMSALKKYMRLLILPVAIGLAWRDPSMARRAAGWYAAGSAILALACYLVWFDRMPSGPWWRVGDQADSFAFKNHITIGILLSFSAVGSFLYASHSQELRARLAWIAAGVFCTVPVIFLSQGRTGYVALLLGLIVLFLLRVRLTARNVLAGTTALALMFTVFYAASSNIQLRVKALTEEIRTENQQSPNGLRASFMLTGAKLFAAHPLIGNGTGAFAEGYAPEARRVWGAGSYFGEARHQPHSEFLNIAVQLGLAGLLLYFALLAAMLRPALRVRAPETDLLVLLWAIYVFCSAFNSLLWDTTEAFWFLILGGCLFAAAAATETRLSRGSAGRA
jgi:O-antigen ligase